MLRWLTRLLMKEHEGDAESALKEMLEAKAAREEAARKLRQTELMGAEVRGLGSLARSLRAQNQFSARITEAFGRVLDD